MNARAWLVLAGIVLTGCRAVVGIDDLRLVDGSAGPSIASGRDGGPTSASEDAVGGPATETNDGGPGDAGAPPPTSDAGGGGACPRGPNCTGCCLNQSGMTAGGFLLNQANMSMCTCGPNQCGAACQTTLCDRTTQPPPMASMDCANCVFAEIVDGGCPAALDACSGDPTCAALATCLKGCGP